MRREIFLLFFLLFLCLGNIFSRHLLTPQSIPLILLSIIILIVASRYTKLSFFLIFFTIGILGEQYSPFEKIFPSKNQISIENIFSEERENVSVQMDSLYKKYDSEATGIIKALSIGISDNRPGKISERAEQCTYWHFRGCTSESYTASSTYSFQ